jgi:hypothetical protein
MRPPDSKIINMTKNTTWYPEIKRSVFQTAACDAERYQKELAERIKKAPKENLDHLKKLHDEYLAKWFVYDSLSVNLCLESRGKLLEKIKEMLICRPHSPFHDSFDSIYCVKRWEEELEKVWKDNQQP